MKKLSLEEKRELGIRKHRYVFRKGLFTREQIREMNKNNLNYVDDEKFEVHANAIQNYSDRTNYNIISIGKELSDFKEEYKNVGNDFYNAFLRDSRVKLGRVQASKYRGIYKYSLTIEDKCQLTDDLRVFGLEKICMLMQIENPKDRELLKVFINKEGLNDKKTKLIINDIKNKGLTLKEAIDNYWKRLQMKAGLIPNDEKLMPEKKTNDGFTKHNYERILAENQYLKEENLRLIKVVECYQRGETLIDIFNSNTDVVAEKVNKIR